MTVFYRFARFLSKTVFFLLYHHRVIGRENLPKGAAIIAPNHVSFLDPPIIAASSPLDVYFLARDSLFQRRVLGFFIRKLHALPVAREAADLQSIKKICRALEKGNKVVIFPEGARSYGGNLTTLKTGVAMVSLRTGAPVVPVFISGSYEIWPKGRKFPKLKGRTVCAFGTPISPSNYASMGKKEAQTALTADLKLAISALQQLSA